MEGEVFPGRGAEMAAGGGGGGRRYTAWLYPYLSIGRPKKM